MTPGLFALLVVAGGVGASVRYLLDAWIKARTKGAAFPWSTAIINLTGSPVLGFLTGLVASHHAPTDVSAIVGGYTTFSTASYETVQLVRKQQYGLAAAYGVGVLVLSIALAFGGYYWGSHL